MVFAKRKGYRVERKIKLFLEKNGWRVVRAGGSIGEADLICIKNKSCFLLQVKSSKRKKFYYYGYMDRQLEGFPFLLLVDFGYGKIRVTEPMKKISTDDGVDFFEFVENNK